jgi:hypothetical protein
MATEAVGAIKSRKGATVPEIRKYIADTHEIEFTKTRKTLLTKALRELSEDGILGFGNNKCRFKLASKVNKVRAAARFVGKLKVKQKRKAKLRADRAKMLDRVDRS